MGKPIIADKKELLAQSSYLTRLNSQGCRETSRNKTAYIVSVTFNSDMFPKIKDRNSVYKQTTTAKVFQIIPNKEYKNVVTVLDESEIFKIDTNGVANIFRFFDAETKELICVGYAYYENDQGQNALQAKPTKLVVRKIKGTTKLDVDTIFEHFLHDWAASFDLDNLYIIDKETDENAKEIPIAKNESQLWAAKNACSKDSNTLPWSTYDQGRVMDETVQKTYRLRGSNIDEDKIIAAYIGPQLFGDDFLKKLDIAGKSFRASPFKNSKLFKIYYSPNLTLKIFAGPWINQVESSLMGKARKNGFEIRAKQLQRKLEKRGFTKIPTKPNDYGIPNNVIGDKNLGGGAPAGQRQRLPPQDSNAFRVNIKPMIDNVIAGNFGQIEMLADLLAKNGYERYTITKIGNDDIGTIVNAFLNNPKNQDLINQFANLVKECHFRLDCKSRKQVQGKESLLANQANRNTKSKRIKDSYQNLQNTFNEFVKSQYFTNYEGKDFVIKDNYETLKKKYINFFIDLQQRVKRTRKGRGQLSINSKTAIKSEYDEDSQPSRLSRVGNFFMNLWSELVGKKFKKRSKEILNPPEEPGLNLKDVNLNDPTPLPGSEEVEPPVANVDAYTPLENKFNQLQTRVETFLNNPNPQGKDNLVKTVVDFYNQVNDDMNVFGNTDNRYEKLKGEVNTYLNEVYETIFKKVVTLTPRQNISNFEFGIQLFSELTNSNSNNTILADRTSKVTNLMNRLNEITKDEAGILPNVGEEAEGPLPPLPGPLLGRPPTTKGNYALEAAAKAREKLGRKYIHGAYELVDPLPEIGSPAAKPGSKLVGPEKLPEPGPAAAAKPQNTSVTDLPKGWYKTVDSEGRPYYYNNSGRTTWTKPPQPTRTRARTRPFISPLTRVPDERARSDDPKPESDKRPSIISRLFSKKSTDKRPSIISQENQERFEKAEQAMAEARAYGTDPTLALQKAVSKGFASSFKNDVKKRQKKAENEARSVWGKYYTGFGGSKTKKNTTKKNVTKKNVTKKKYAKKVTGLKKRKGKKGKTHRAAKKTGRRYYLKTLKKRK